MFVSFWHILHPLAADIDQKACPILYKPLSLKTCISYLAVQIFNWIVGHSSYIMHNRKAASITNYMHSWKWKDERYIC